MFLLSVYMSYGLSQCIAQYFVFRLYNSALVTIIYIKGYLTWLGYVPGCQLVASLGVEPPLTCQPPCFEHLKFPSGSTKPPRPLVPVSGDKYSFVTIKMHKMIKPCICYLKIPKRNILSPQPTPVGAQPPDHSTPCSFPSILTLLLQILPLGCRWEQCAGY